MGAQLISYFGEAQKISGSMGTMRLTMLTGMSAKSAETAPDSPENINKFRSALEQIRKGN